MPGAQLSGLERGAARDADQDTSWEMCVEDSHAALPGPGQLICQHADFRGREFGSSASRMSRWQVRAVEFYSHFYSSGTLLQA